MQKQDGNAKKTIGRISPAGPGRTKFQRSGVKKKKRGFGEKRTITDAGIDSAKHKVSRKGHSCKRSRKANDSLWTGLSQTRATYMVPLKVGHCVVPEGVGTEHLAKERGK